MKKIKLIYVIILFFSLSIAWFMLYKPNVKYHSVVTSGIVIDKSENEIYKIKVEMINEIDNKKQVDILVKEENTWNLIEVGKAYFISFSWKNNDIPTLNQIENSPHYKDIFAKRE